MHDNTVKVAVHCGEAVNLCHELQDHQPHCQSLPKCTRRYDGPWSARQLVLWDPEAIYIAKQFDVINRLNLNDHVSILNILPATVPLLSRHACSVLYTESLLLAAEHTSESLNALIHSDITALSLIIGVAPVGTLLGTTTDSASTEIMSAWLGKKSPGRQTQFRIHIPWKIPRFSDWQNPEASNGLQTSTERIGVNSEELAAFFFGLYRKMFAFEDLSQMISLTQRQIHTPLAGDLRFYSRLTLVALLHLAKSQVLTDWAKCVDVLLQKIENDRSLILSSNNLQELYVHLHLSELWENPALEMDPRAAAAAFGTSRPVTGETGLLQHYDIPSVVYVVLVVPRSKLGVFDEPLESTGTPGLHISVSQQGMFENSFFGIGCCFGQLKAELGTALTIWPTRIPSTDLATR